jgi:hypothetical protein
MIITFKCILRKQVVVMRGVRNGLRIGSSGVKPCSCAERDLIQIVFNMQCDCSTVMYVSLTVVMTRVEATQQRSKRCQKGKEN